MLPGQWGAQTSVGKVLVGLVRRRDWEGIDVGDKKALVVITCRPKEPSQLFVFLKDSPTFFSLPDISWLLLIYFILNEIRCMMGECGFQILDGLQLVEREKER